MTVEPYAEFEANGFTVIPQVLDVVSITRMKDDLAGIPAGNATKRRGQSYFGIRDLLNLLPSVHDLANSTRVRSVVTPIAGEAARVVRGIFFDKTPQANWKVGWHQDITIAVRDRKDVSGFTGWSEKAGITHVQAPVFVLEKMVAIRLHLDAADSRSGALRVVPGSHRHGRLSGAEIEGIKKTTPPVTLSLEEGDALLMRPLLLHSSSVSNNGAYRRVIHLEFAATDLPGGLEWHLS